MPNVYSDQYQTQYVSVPSAPVKANENGKVRAKFFNLNTTADPVNSGDTIFLGKLPPGGRILGGARAFGGMGGGGALAIGVAGTTGKYLAATSVAAAGKLAIADTVALGFGEGLLAETTLICAGGGGGT